MAAGVMCNDITWHQDKFNAVKDKPKSPFLAFLSRLVLFNRL